MNKLMSVVLGLSLLAPVVSLAQDTGGDKAATTGKKPVKTKTVSKGKKKGTEKNEKSKKGSGGSTTPPPK